MSIKYHYDIEQNTDKWYEIRLGIVTASEMNTILTPTGKLAGGAKVMMYAGSLMAERKLNVVEDSFQSFDMMRGHFQEEIAREIYHDNYSPVTECGFITREFDGFKIGASPDGLVGEDGGIEIKSRLAKFQVQTIVADAVPAEYMNQIQALLLVSGRKWWDFVQYSNGLPLFVKRVLPDIVLHDKILNTVKGLEEMIEMIATRFDIESANMVQTERIEINIGDDMIEPSLNDEM